MKVTVFLGASLGNRDVYKEEVARLGRLLATSGHKLVYGGSNIGLMGILVSEFKRNGGHAHGIEVKRFYDAGMAFNDCDEYDVVETMSIRKNMMIDEGDVYVVLPGGVGTLDEMFEVLTDISLDYPQKRVIVLNTVGFYDELKRHIVKMVDEGFYKKENFEKIFWANNPEEVIDFINKCER